MDLDLLINAVREEKLLWNKKHKDYRNRLLSRRAWRRVADGIGCTSEDAQKKWKNLRDSFVRELKKIPRRRSGAGAEDGGGEYKGDWPYFEAMKFLDVVVKPRKSATSLSRTLLDETDIHDDTIIMSVESDSTGISGNTDTITENSLSHATEVQFESEGAAMSTENQNLTPGTSQINQSSLGTLRPQSFDDQPPAADVGKKKKKPNDFSEVFMDFEREKIMLLKKDMDVQDDEDMNWFKSISPYLKKLPPINKLLFRTNVQEMLLNELAKLETPPQSSTAWTPSSTIPNFNTNYAPQ